MGDFSKFFKRGSFPIVGWFREFWAGYLEIPRSKLFAGRGLGCGYVPGVGLPLFTWLGFGPKFPRPSLFPSLRLAG